jgi:hypothetical protein
METISLFLLLVILILAVRFVRQRRKEIEKLEEALAGQYLYTDQPAGVSYHCPHCGSEDIFERENPGDYRAWWCNYCWSEFERPEMAAVYLASEVEG